MLDKILKKSIFVRETIYRNTKTETNFLHKRSLCHGNKFSSQKQPSYDFLSEKPTSVVEKSFFTENFVCHRVKLLSKEKKQVDIERHWAVVKYR